MRKRKKGNTDTGTKTGAEGKQQGGESHIAKARAYPFAETGIATDVAIAAQLDNVNRVVSSGKINISPEKQVQIMLSTIAKMLTLQNARLRARNQSGATGMAGFFLSEHNPSTKGPSN